MRESEKEDKSKMKKKVKVKQYDQWSAIEMQIADDADDTFWSGKKIYVMNV